MSPMQPASVLVNTDTSPDTLITMGLRVEPYSMTPQAAREFRDVFHFPNQRPIRAKHVKYLANEMREGRFNVGTPIHIGVMPDGHWYILNGNHTLEAVYESGMTIMLTLIEVPCKDIEEAGLIYARLDLQTRRNADDAARAMGHGNLMPSSSWQTALGAAVPYLYSDFTDSRTKLRNEERTDVMVEWAPYARLYREQVINGNGMMQRMLMRGAVMAAGAAVFRYMPAEATRFWNTVALDDGLRNVDPCKQLINWLHENGSDRKSDDRLAACKAVGVSWNAWLSGHERSHIKPGSMKGVHFSGTPYAR